MQPLLQKFFALLRFSLLGEVLPEDFSCDESERTEFYKISKAHDISAMVAYALDENGLMGDDKASRKLKEELIVSVGRVTLLEGFAQEVFDVFKKSGIDYIPLKGSVIRKLYPQDFFRTSTDIDVLIRKEGFDKACDVVEKELNLTRGARTPHDVPFNRSPIEHIEIHHTLVEEEYANGAGELLEKAWDYAFKNDDGSYSFSNEFFKFYHITHMLKHFENAGCGIRFFIDLYYIRQFDIDAEKYKKMLEAYNLVKFDEICEKVVDNWLLGKAADELTKNLEDYVLNAGIYGNLENNMMIGEKKSGNKVKYFFRRLFMPYSQLKNKYPSLEGKRILTPIYQFRRIFEMIFRGETKKRLKEAKQIKNLDREKQDKIVNLFEQLGII